jgi:seryl-tRNA synthetase
MDPITIPQPECPNTFFPTKAQLMSCFGEIANLPAKLKAEIAKLKTQATTFDLEKELQKIKEDFSKEATELKQQLQAQAEQLEQQLEAELKEQIESIVAEVEKIKKYLEKIEKLIDSFLASMSDPVYPDLRSRVLEWERRITAMTQEFHLYLQTKILELIDSIIPVSFEINVFGLNVDLVKLFTDKDYRAQLKAQIKADLEKFYAQLEEEYKSFTGYFGTDSSDIKLEVIWSNMMAKLEKGALNLIWDLMGQLIDLFDTIWDALGLPGRPSLTNLNVKDLIKNAIADFKQSLIDGAAEIKAKVKEKVEALEKAAKETAEEVKQQLIAEAEKLDAQITAKIKEMKEIAAKVEKALKSLSLSAGSYSFSLEQMIGGEIDDAILSIERRIDRYVEALRDFGEHLPERVFMDWIDDIMQFLEEIGLGSIADWTTFTFCDFMDLIGVPKTIDLESTLIKKLPV